VPYFDPDGGVLGDSMPDPFCSFCSFCSLSFFVVVCFLVVLVEPLVEPLVSDDPVLPLIPVPLVPIPEWVSPPMVPELDAPVPDWVSLLDPLLPVCPCAWLATNTMPAAARPSPHPKYFMIPPLRFGSTSPRLAAGTLQAFRWMEITLVT
jgi:hypothetical protein